MRLLRPGEVVTARGVDRSLQLTLWRARFPRDQSDLLHVSVGPFWALVLATDGHCVMLLHRGGIYWASDVYLARAE